MNNKYKFDDRFNAVFETEDLSSYFDKQMAYRGSQIETPAEVEKKTFAAHDHYTYKTIIYNIFQNFIAESVFDHFLLFTADVNRNGKRKFSLLTSNWEPSALYCHPLEDLVDILDIPSDKTDDQGESIFNYDLTKSPSAFGSKQNLHSFYEHSTHLTGLGHSSLVDKNRNRKLFMLLGGKQDARALDEILAKMIFSSVLHYIKETNVDVIDNLPKISKREIECIQWTSEGKTSYEISVILGLSENTINNYISSVTRKLGAVNRAHMISIAFRNKILS